MGEVSRYRKLYPRIWRHPGFIGLHAKARELTLYLLTGPQSSRIGLFHFSPATAAEDLLVSVATLRNCLSEVCTTFGWVFDSEARVFFIPSWWRWNPPENANVLNGNLKDLSDIGACGLVDAFIANIDALPDDLHETFLEACRIRLPKRSTIQEQKQFQNQEQDRGSRSNSARACANGLLTLVPQAIRDAGENATMEQLVDSLLWHARSRLPGQTFRKADARQAFATVSQNTPASVSGPHNTEASR